MQNKEKKTLKTLKDLNLKRDIVDKLKQEAIKWINALETTAYIAEKNKKQYLEDIKNKVMVPYPFVNTHPRWIIDWIKKFFNIK